jgi:hypothetical protein
VGQRGFNLIRQVERKWWYRDAVVEENVPVDTDNGTDVPNPFLTVEHSIPHTHYLVLFVCLFFFIWKLTIFYFLDYFRCFHNSFTLPYLFGVVFTFFLVLTGNLPGIFNLSTQNPWSVRLLSFRAADCSSSSPCFFSSPSGYCCCCCCSNIGRLLLLCVISLFRHTCPLNHARESSSSSLPTRPVPYSWV